jgi:FkbM family methyltransferase
MGLVGELARRLPSRRLRRFCRDFIDTELRGFPRAALKYRGSELKLSLDMVLSHYRVSHPKVRYMQVGAFDGILDDPIYPLIQKHNLEGILVEPQRDAFERLKANYARFDPAAFVFLNVAIGARDEIATLYRIKSDAPGPEWLHGIASFDRNVILNHAHVIPNLESLIEPEEVRRITFATLFQETGIHRVDMLQIDAEGYDAEILRLFDVPLRKPAIIHFEHKHLSLAGHEQAVASLVHLGYKFAICGENTFAYLTDQGLTE